MKHFLIQLIAVLTLGAVMINIQAAKPKSTVNSATLHVDGEFSKNDDQELKFLQDELKNVKGLKRGYKRKAKVYQKLTDESEQLKENFESYVGNRVEYEDAIGGYNKTIECLKSGDATKCRPDLKKKKKKSVPVQRAPRAQRRMAPEQSFDTVGTTMAAVKRPSHRGDANNFLREVDSRISSRDRELLSCYRKGGYSQQGVLRVQLKISGNGNLGHIGFEDTSEVNDKRVVNCLAQVLYSITYPTTPSGRMTTVKKPFVFHLM
jgi:hypothetical protein